MLCRDNEWIGPQGDERRAGEGGPLKRVARNDSFMTSMEEELEELEKQSTKESDRKLERLRRTRVGMIGINHVAPSSFGSVAHLSR